MRAPHPVSGHKTGVLLTNLGTPDAPTYWALRRYLAEFLMDPRVVELPRWLWGSLLQGLLLQIIPFKSARNYRKIWDKKHHDSPLRVISLAQAKGLQKRLGAKVPVVLAMRYGNPSIASGLKQLKALGCDRVVHLPLYPQYSAVTTASNVDAVHRVLAKWRWQPAVTHLGAYYDHPGYIQALAQSVEDGAQGLKWTPDKILFSYHGIPKKYFMAGDPYPCHCWKTTRLVKETLGLDEGQVITSFQSRFGKQEWVRPYTDELLRTLPAQGVKKLVVVTPAFAADCVETLEEIADAGRDTFMAAGGTHFHVVPCLNDQKAHLDFLAQLIKENL